MGFKLIIAGSRHLSASFNFLKGLMLLHEIPVASIDHIICGEAPGIDHAGKCFAERLCIPVILKPAKWDVFAKGDPVAKRKDGTIYNPNAGPKRNMEMANLGDALLLIWDGHSKGSFNMKSNMLSLNKPIFEVILNGPSQKHRKELGIYIPPEKRGSPNQIILSGEGHGKQNRRVS